jgi:hypothetical protein
MVGVEDVLSYFESLCIILRGSQMLINSGLKSSARSVSLSAITIISKIHINTIFKKIAK